MSNSEAKDIPDSVSPLLVLQHLLGETQHLININKGIVALLSQTNLQNDVRPTAILILNGAIGLRQGEVDKIRKYLEKYRRLNVVKDDPMSNPQPTEASQHLIALAKRNAEIYKTLPELRALIVTGSSVEGVSDYYSDIDMILYYDTLPSEEALAAAAEHNGGTNRRQLAPRGDEQAIEQYDVRGVACQFAHSTIRVWEEEMATILEKLEVVTPTQKALSGLLECIPLYGENLIRRWQDKLNNFPEPVAQAMVEHYMAFFPLWGLQDRLITRDAKVWSHEVLVQTAQNVLGVLAGINHLYYSTFQFNFSFR
jgi:hypothetical protein